MELGHATVDGKSLLAPLTLGASQGKWIRLRAPGERAGELVAALAPLVEGRFGGKQ